MIRNSVSQIISEVSLEMNKAEPEELKQFVWDELFHMSKLEHDTPEKFVEKSTKWEPKLKSWIFTLTWCTAEDLPLFVK